MAGDLPHSNAAVKLSNTWPPNKLGGPHHDRYLATLLSS
jgi:hypothetical protein